MTRAILIAALTLFFAGCQNGQSAQPTPVAEASRPADSTTDATAKISGISASVEESRIPLAQTAIPDVVSKLDKVSQAMASGWPQTNNYTSAANLVDRLGNKLWLTAKAEIQATESYDDRALYWQRLKLSQILRTKNPGFAISPEQRNALLDRLEKSSRGLADLNYRESSHLKILLTGFDPFLLDRNIDQSNPSGVTAMLMDGAVIEFDGITAEINTFMVPVKYGDFDQGLIESSLAPFYALNSVDMVTTVSMGRSDFDLERFPGKRRSASAPGNNNIYSGGSKDNPVISRLNNRPLPGPEFIEFSLPVKAMQKAKGAYKINDNHQVTTLEKTFSPAILEELKGSTAVAGSGGGYLSNEISYRSIRLRNELNSWIPTGHIHTPRIKAFEPDTTKKIVTQIREMLKQSLPELEKTRQKNTK